MRLHKVGLYLDFLSSTPPPQHFVENISFQFFLEPETFETNERRSSILSICYILEI